MGLCSTHGGKNYNETKRLKNETTRTLSSTVPLNLTSFANSGFVKDSAGHILIPRFNE